jgi:DNA-binding GntR family transcriptional regulator
MAKLEPLLKSRTERVYAALRADILACRLKPGTRILINELCRSLEVSLGAVREGLSRLTAEGLVIAEPQKGFTVSPISLDDLEDLTRTRIEIETMCLRRAIAVGGVEWEIGIISEFHRLSRLPERRPEDEKIPNEPWMVSHGAFHLALVAACDSPWLLRMRALLFAQSDRYRYFSASAERYDRDVLQEHRAIMNATLARDEKTACRLLSEHLALTATMVRDVAQSIEMRVGPEPAGKPVPARRRAARSRRHGAAARTATA